MKKFFLLLLLLSSIVSTTSFAQTTGGWCVYKYPQTGKINPNARVYEAPTSLCNANNWTFSIISAPSGHSATFTTSTNKMTVAWETSGVYVIRAEISCGAWIDVFYKTIWVINEYNVSWNGTLQEEYANIRLSNVSNCSYPNTSFTVSNPVNNPIASYALQITEVDASGNSTGAYNWSNTPVYPADGLMGNITYSSATNGFNLQAGKRYRVMINVTNVTCASIPTASSATYITIKPTGANVTPVININGSSNQPVEACSSASTPVTLYNTAAVSANSCGDAEIELYGFVGTAFTDQACSTSNFPLLGTYRVSNGTSYNLYNLFSNYISQGGLFKVRMRNMQSPGNSAWSNWACFKINTPSNAVFGFASTTSFNAGGNDINQTNWTPNVVSNSIEIGPLSPGLKFKYSAPEGVSEYKIVITENHHQSGAFTSNIYDSGWQLPSPCTNPVSPTPCTFSFTDKQMGPTGAQSSVWFFLQANANPTAFAARRFKVSLSVKNAYCGTNIVTKETFIKFKTSGGSCPSCRVSSKNRAEENEDQTIELKTTVIPNPTTGKIQIIIPSEKEEIMNIEIINMSGQVVATPEYNQITTLGMNIIDYDATDLPTGVYIYSVKTLTQHQTGKFIKQ